MPSGERNTQASILARFDRSGGPDACHPWTGMERSGYGRVRWNGRLSSTHVLAFLWAGGVVPDGHEVGHVCHDADTACQGGMTCPHRLCGNTRHLEAQTRAKNTASGRTPSINRARAEALTQCVNGHEYTEDNTLFNPDGSRYCRTCKRISNQVQYQGRKARGYIVPSRRR